VADQDTERLESIAQDEEPERSDEVEAHRLDEESDEPEVEAHRLVRFEGRDEG
jgi:hypothetical protein